MLEISYKNQAIGIKNSENILISLFLDEKCVAIGDYKVDFPGEYEKSNILLEVKEFEQKLFYSFMVEWYSIVCIYDDTFEPKEELVSFFGDIDILCIIGSKLSAKISENIEAKVILPFGEGREVFLHTLGQNKDPVEVYKVKGEISGDTTEYVNLI